MTAFVLSQQTHVAHKAEHNYFLALYRKKYANPLFKDFFLVGGDLHIASNIQRISTLWFKNRHIAIQILKGFK